MATYLLTGVAGFIASSVCRRLLEEGHHVVGVDNLNDYYDVRLKDYRLGQLLADERWREGISPCRSVFANEAECRNGRFVFFPRDVEDLPGQEELFRRYRFDAIFNLAARAGVRASMENPYKFLSTNTEGTLNLLECQRRFGVAKQVLASTSSLYTGCQMPFTEDLPVNTPLSPYAASKKAAELMAYSYHKLYGLDISVLRYFTVFGPAGRPDMAPFRFIKWIDEGSPLTVFGDGTQARDFTFVEDIARGTTLAVKPLGYEIINLGGGRSPLSLSSLIDSVAGMLNRRPTLVFRPVHVADVRETWADISKAERLLGWRPQYSREEALKLTVNWHIANRDWLSSIVV